MIPTRISKSSSPHHSSLKLGKTDSFLVKDVFQLLFLFLITFGTLSIFLATSELAYSGFLSWILSVILSPWTAAFERRGFSRRNSIILLLIFIGNLLILIGFYLSNSGAAEWNSFKQTAPHLFQTAIIKLETLENQIKDHYPILNFIHPTQKLLKWGSESWAWILENGAPILGSLMTILLMTPAITFVLLNEGPTLQRKFFQLVPNRYFETFFVMTTQITKAITDYLRAKLIEAFLVALIVTLGLKASGAPYPLVLGIIAGITNIIPYLGPFLGSIPGLLMAQGNSLILVIITYAVANIIDMFIIFPLIVSKLVNLHPLILIATVMLGQHYHGLIGMLISIPIATIIKVLLNELYYSLY